MINFQENIAAANYVYVRRDGRSDLEKCMDSSKLQDIMNKQLKNEQLTDEDIERVNTCINERQESAKGAGKLGLILFLVICVIGVIAELIIS